MGDLDLKIESLRETFERKLIESRESISKGFEKRLAALELARDEEQKQVAKIYDEIKTHSEKLQLVKVENQIDDTAQCDGIKTCPAELEAEVTNNYILKRIRDVIPQIRLYLDESGSSSAKEQRLVANYSPRQTPIIYGEDPDFYEKVLKIQDRFKACGLPEREWANMFLRYHFSDRLNLKKKDSQNWNTLMAKLFENYDFDCEEERIRYEIQTFAVFENFSPHCAGKVKDQLHIWVDLGCEYHHLQLFDGIRSRYSRFLKEHDIKVPAGDLVKNLNNFDDLRNHIDYYVPNRLLIPFGLTENKSSCTSVPVANDLITRCKYYR
ncbi:hypothetical protein CANARDRAFT_5653 [[Candida] arabinofermentans NRRL YB-2248]|uniref:Uncharacterized protein n=1 Tax=[Candida] arabinofermentans NRRL YB-2248 TaxID=983967 RepID=A0A1E4T5S1_9ASCO|nr:hypothetical protein CANARDRAFT_5653 [[Candida] arabinofermentans NRRL YB-2248]